MQKSRKLLQEPNKAQAHSPYKAGKVLFFVHFYEERTRRDEASGDNFLCQPKVAVKHNAKKARGLKGESTKADRQIGRQTLQRQQFKP